jgi:hypothetical protein
MLMMLESNEATVDSVATLWTKAPVYIYGFQEPNQIKNPTTGNCRLGGPRGQKRPPSGLIRVCWVFFGVFFEEAGDVEIRALTTENSVATPAPVKGSNETTSMRICIYYSFDTFAF